MHHHEHGRVLFLPQAGGTATCRGRTSNPRISLTPSRAGEGDRNGTAKGYEFDRPAGRLHWAVVAVGGVGGCLALFQRSTRNEIFQLANTALLCSNMWTATLALRLGAAQAAHRFRAQSIYIYILNTEGPSNGNVLLFESLFARLPFRLPSC